MLTRTKLRFLIERETKGERDRHSIKSEEFRRIFLLLGYYNNTRCLRIDAY